MRGKPVSHQACREMLFSRLSSQEVAGIRAWTRDELYREETSKMIDNLIIDMVADELALKTMRSSDEIKQKGLSAYDYSSNTVEIDFEDGSTVKFKRAFYVEDVEDHVIAVFTEHCGYHVFCSLGATIK